MVDSPYTLIHADKATAARVGKLQTTHGVVNTPNIYACRDTRYSESMHPADAFRSDSGRNYSRQYLPPLPTSPDTRLSKRQAGCTAFMGWQRPILTDSGGFSGL